MKYDIVCSTKNLSTEEWLKIRTLGIGGSDAGIIAGCNPYRSIFELWQEKRGEIPVREEESEVIHFGKVLEDVVRKEFIQRTGLMVRKKNSILRSKEYPFMMVSSVSLTALILFLKQRPLLNLKIMTGRMERFLKPISYRFSTIWQSQAFRKRTLLYW